MVREAEMKGPRGLEKLRKGFLINMVWRNRQRTLLQNLSPSLSIDSFSSSADIAVAVVGKPLRLSVHPPLDSHPNPFRKELWINYAAQGDEADGVSRKR